MNALLITDLITTLSLEEGLMALADGFRVIMNSAPPRGCLAVLGAQSVLETGSFQKMHRWNAGNMKKPATWEGLYTRFKCDEIFDPATAKRAQQLGPCSVAPWKGGPNMRVVLVPPHPWTEFVAFDTAAKGMAEHIKLLSCTDRYRTAWSRAYAGDVIGTAQALHTASYFTADLDPYAKGMALIAAKLSPICKTVLGAAPLVSDEDRVRISDLVASTMAESRWGSAEPFPLLNA